MLEHLLLGFHSQNLEGILMTIQLSVCLFMIHHPFFWDFRDCISEVNKRADMVSEAVQCIHLDKDEIRFVEKMLCYF